MVDLDDFKNINDTCGHLVGDAVLRGVAQRLTALMRSYDSVGRYGGEEFVVVLPRCNREQARSMAERLRTAFANEPVNTPHGTFAVTLSCGVGIIDSGSSESIEQFIRAADDALYKAKRGGRNRVEEFA